MARSIKFIIFCVRIQLYRYYLLMPLNWIRCDDTNVVISIQLNAITNQIKYVPIVVDANVLHKMQYFCHMLHILYCIPIIRTFFFFIIHYQTPIYMRPFLTRVLRLTGIFISKYCCIITNAHMSNLNFNWGGFCFFISTSFCFCFFFHFSEKEN